MEKPTRVVAVDLPLKIEDQSKAVAMLGGPQQLLNACENPDVPLELRLRRDPFHHPITARRVDTQTLIMELDLPKSALEAANGDVRKAIELANGDYSATAKHFAELSFRFREMADFQYYTGDSPFVQKLKNSVFSENLAGIQKVELEGLVPIDPAKADAMPPPRFSQQPQPFFYAYRQNPSVSVVDDGTGERKLVNKATHSRIISEILVWGDKVPTQPPKELDPNPRAVVQTCVDQLRELFEIRPSYTRRALEALVPAGSVRYLRYALPYVSYFYRSGPWRGAYIAYGKDPTKDVKFCKYQVEHFRLTAENESSTPIYQFDGTTLPTTRMLQLCDITDGFIKLYVDSDEPRSEVDGSDGWYKPETINVIRRVLKAKLVNASEKRPPLTLKVLTALVEEARATSQKETKQVPEMSDSESD